MSSMPPAKRGEVVRHSVLNLLCRCSITQLEPELNNARPFRSYQSAELWPAESGGVAIRQIEIHIIQNVKEFGPELQLLRFVNGDMLQDRQIPNLQRWRPIIGKVAADIPEGIAGRIREGARV